MVDPIEYFLGYLQPLQLTGSLQLGGDFFAMFIPKAHCQFVWLGFAPSQEVSAIKVVEIEPAVE